MYGQMVSAVPDWVFGGEYGQVANVLTDRDQRAANLRRTELSNDIDEIAVEDKRRRNEYEKSIGDVLGGSMDTPLTLRDLYQLQRRKALETGNPDIAMQIEEKLRQQEESQAAKKFSELTTAAKLADDYSYEKTRELFPWMTKADYDEIRRPKTKGSGEPKKEKAYKMIGPNGIEELVPESQFNARAQQGFKSKRSELEDLIDRLSSDSLNREAVDDLSDRQRGLSQAVAPGGGASATMESGQVAPRDMKLRDPQTGQMIVIRKGERIP
jgi:hypothetical protein